MVRLTAQPAAACRPGPQGPRTLIVGTHLTAAQLLLPLAVVQPRPRIIGCLLAAREPQERFACPVLGELDDLSRVLEETRIDQVLVTLPATLAEPARAAAETCERRGVTWRFVPSLNDALAGRLDLRSLGLGGERPAGEVDPAQLISREPRPLDEAAIRACLTGKTVLITGAGGSIGSELARMACRFNPGRLVLVERGENALFEVDRAIGRLFPAVPRAAELHDVTQRAATLRLLEKHQPHAIVHAAAHKHVPMMEDHPAAAIENNFFGTRHIADAALACGAERFVMVSTDKAVNPSSVMGATKRLAELYIQHLSRAARTGEGADLCHERSPALQPKAAVGGATIFSMVRFGNVLGSACSVLPIWQDQLARRGPITVTDPRMTRYFMTIPEAAGLVLQAGALSRGGEVFLLDMGQPIRILDLAERFLRMHGFEPGLDVPIAFTGVRPGEKLSEELAYDGEDMLPTPHGSIRIWRTYPPDAAHIAQVAGTFDRLRNRDPHHPWSTASRDAVVTALRAAIPEMVTSAAAG